MMRSLQWAASAAVLLCAIGATEAATFTYHGSLQDAGKPAEGRYDIELTLYSGPHGGSVLGGPLILHGVAMHHGEFSTEADFGPLAKMVGDVAYVEVGVRGTGETAFATLDARAMVSASSSTTVCPGAWTLQGNAGNPSGSYLGTADTQPLVFEVAATQVGNISETGTDQPTVVFGASTNAAAGVSATISGGQSNTLLGAYSTIAGGQSNIVGLAEWSVVSGGHSNSAGGNTATIGGGFSNQANGVNSTVSGGDNNNASGKNSIVGGGVQNSAVGSASSVPGGALNYAGGDLSFAAGGDAKVRDATQAGNSSTCTVGSTCGDYGTFVWNGAYPAAFTSSGPQQFLVNAPGEVGINGQPAVDGDLSTYAGVTINGNFASNGVADLALVPTGSAAGNVSGGFSVAQFDVVAFSPVEQPNTGYLEINATGSPGAVFFLDNSGNLTITGSASKPGGGAWSTISDRRIKQDVVPIHEALDTIMKLRPVNFRYTPDYRVAHGNLPDKSYAGFIAQEFAEVFPEAVTSTSERVPGAPADAAPILALDPNPALITTVAAVQELAVRAQSDDDDIAMLKRDNADLRRQLADVIARLRAVEETSGE